MALEYIFSSEMAADTPTKFLSRAKHETNKHLLGVMTVKEGMV